MKNKDIRELTVTELEKKIRDTRDQLLHDRMRKQTGTIENPQIFKQSRREIARMETIRNEKIKAASA